MKHRARPGDLSTPVCPKPIPCPPCLSIQPLHRSKSCRPAQGQMLDTVRMKTPGKMLRPVARVEWLASLVKPFTSPDGLFLYAVECSLPRLLWEHNGRPIASQAELAAAWERLFAVTTSFADVPPLADWLPGRLDLVWQLAVPDAGAVIDALSGLRYPGIRSPAIHQAGRCVTWRGAGSRFMVQAYDKSAKARQPGEVLRVEVRLRGSELRQLHGRDWRDFSALYATYRELVNRLPDVSLPEGKCGWPEAVARAVPAEFHEAVLARLGQAPRTVRDARQRMRLASAQRTPRLTDLFPTDNPPPPITVEPRRREPRKQP